MSATGRAFIIIVVIAIIGAGLSLFGAALTEGGVPGTVPEPAVVETV